MLILCHKTAVKVQQAVGYMCSSYKIQTDLHEHWILHMEQKHHYRVETLTKLNRQISRLEAKRSSTMQGWLRWVRAIVNCSSCTKSKHDWSHMSDVCTGQLDNPWSSLRSQRCVFDRSSSPQDWHPSAASSSPTCPFVLHRWTHPGRAPLYDKGQLFFWIFFFYHHFRSRLDAHAATTINTSFFFNAQQSYYSHTLNHSWSILKITLNSPSPFSSTSSNIRSTTWSGVKRLHSSSSSPWQAFFSR